MNNQKRCTVCGKSGELFKCAGCNQIVYCGEECQLKDWPRHESECKRLQTEKKERPLPPRKANAPTPQRTINSNSSANNPTKPSQQHQITSNESITTHKEEKCKPNDQSPEGEAEGDGGENSRWNKMARFMKDKKDSAVKGMMNIKDSVAEMHIAEKTKRAFESVKFGSDQPSQEELEQAANNDIDELLAPPKPEDIHAVFGVPYEVAVERSSTIVPGIPDVVVFCLAFLDRCGFEEEGIFRLSGSKREIAILRGVFQAGGPPPRGNMTSQHSISGLLKLYFRELPEGIFTRRKQVTPTASQNKYKCVYDSLYEPFKPVVPFLFYFLRKTYEKREINKMTENNLAIIFSPVLGTSSDVIVHFVLEYDQIFPPSDRPKLPPEWPNVNFSRTEMVPLSKVSTSTETNHSTPPKTNHVPMPTCKVHNTTSTSSTSTTNTGSTSHLSASVPLPPKTNHVSPSPQPQPVRKTTSLAGFGNGNDNASSPGRNRRKRLSAGFYNPINVQNPPPQPPKTIQKTQPKQQLKAPQQAPPQKPLPQQKKALPTPPQPQPQQQQQQHPVQKKKPVSPTQTLRRPFPTLN